MASAAARPFTASPPRPLSAARRGGALALTAALAYAGAAEARSGGIIGNSGRPGGNGCVTCHANNDPMATVTVDGLAGPDGGPLIAGAPVLLTVAVHSADPTGQGACPNRCGGFNAGVITGVAEFTDGPDTELPSTGPPDEITHSAEKPMDQDGDVSWSVELRPLLAGTHTLYVRARDVNGNERSSGDRLGIAAIEFTVVDTSDGGVFTPRDAGAPDAGADGDGDAGDGDGDDGGATGEGEGELPGGCCGRSSPSGAALLGVGLVALRRRRGTGTGMGMGTGTGMGGRVPFGDAP